jgi:hypothetical protein
MVGDGYAGPPKPSIWMDHSSNAARVPPRQKWRRSTASYLNQPSALQIKSRSTTRRKAFDSA